MSNIQALVDAIKNIDEAYERSPWIAPPEVNEAIVLAVKALADYHKSKKEDWINWNDLENKFTFQVPYDGSNEFYSKEKMLAWRSVIIFLKEQVPQLFTFNPSPYASQTNSIDKK